MIYIVSIS